MAKQYNEHPHFRIVCLHILFRQFTYLVLRRTQKKFTEIILILLLLKANLILFGQELKALQTGPRGVF